MESKNGWDERRDETLSLKVLTKLLIDDDVEAIDEYNAIKSQLVASYIDSKNALQLIDQLSKAISGYDFSAAIEIVEKLLRISMLAMDVNTDLNMDVNDE